MNMATFGLPFTKGHNCHNSGRKSMKNSVTLAIVYIIVSSLNPAFELHVIIDYNVL
jgi:hypothetical protein